jgi:hypothetical protein
VAVLELSTHQSAALVTSLCSREEGHGRAEAVTTSICRAALKAPSGDVPLYRSVDVFFFPQFYL